MGNDSILMSTYLPVIITQPDSSQWVCSKFHYLACYGELVCRQIAWGRLTEPNFHPFPLFIFPFSVPKSKHFFYSFCMWVFLGDILDRCVKNFVYTEMLSQIQLTATVITHHYNCNGTCIRDDNKQCCKLWLGGVLHGWECMPITDLFFK